MSKKSYSTEKSQHVQREMDKGYSNRSANNSWNPSMYSGNDSNSKSTDDRGYIPPSPEWEDYAHTSDDL